MYYDTTIYNTLCKIADMAPVLFYLGYPKKYSFDINSLAVRYTPYIYLSVLCRTIQM